MVDTTAKTSSGAPRNGNDNRTPWFIQTKYPKSSTPLPIASYKEAQLIIAEVQQGQAAVNIINALRAASGLPAFSSTDPTAIANEVITARSRELFLEGQHLYDVKRLNLPLNPAAGIPYSTVYEGRKLWYRALLPASRCRDAEQPEYCRLTEREKGLSSDSPFSRLVRHDCIIMRRYRRKLEAFELRVFPLLPFPEPFHTFFPPRAIAGSPFLSLSTRSWSMDRQLYFPASANYHHFNRFLEARCCCVGY